MSAILPIDIGKLLRNRGVESERVEFKASWDPATTGPQVLRTICAFANDYHNLNGGYVVLGAAERGGRAVLPPKGLSDEEVEAAQKWIRGACNRIDPPYFPVLSPETVEDRRILVAWAPASDAGAHRAPDGRSPPRHRYWIRLGSETVDAERRGGPLTSFLRQKTGIPWDDRPARGASVEDMSETRVREHLCSVGSGLLQDPDARSVYRRMRIVSRVNGHEAPRNVGLLFFARDPRPMVPVRDDRGRPIRRGPGRRHAGGADVPRRAFGQASRMPELSGRPVDRIPAKTGERVPVAALGELSPGGAARNPGQRRVS